MVIAEPLFRLVLTPKWLPAVPYFQILCITGILYPFHVYNLNILNVKGRSDLFLKLEIVKKAFITIGIAISFFFGIYGLLIFQIISSVFAFGVNTWYSGKFINFSAWNQIKEVSPCIGIATLAGVVSWGLHHFLLTGRVNSSLIILCILLAVYGIVYGMLSRILRLKALTEFKQLILKR
jgi:teichuronic acid exporter